MAGLVRDEEAARSADAQQQQQQDASHTSSNISASEKPQLEQSSIGKRLKRHFTSDVDPKWADILLILCFFVSGLVDSVAFNVWACFASMQTGNTIFVGLGVSGQPFTSAPYGWAKSLIAIFCFIFGSFSFANFHRFLGPLRRHTLIISFALQTCFIGISAILATTNVVSGDISHDRVAIDGGKYYTVRLQRINWADLAPLALLAFQSSGQVVASRMLKYNELPTVVLTSLFADLMSDANLLTAGITKDARRNRRVIAAIFLFIGALSGGYLSANWVGLSGALWLAAFLKACMTVCWVFWWPKREKSQSAA